MKIISWNVNGLRAVERKELLASFLAAEQPDILLLQETKSKPEQVAFLDNAYPDYQKFYHSAEKPGYSGVAVWIRSNVEGQMSNVEFVAGMPNDPVANEGRIARLDFEWQGQPYSVLGTYFPNGGKSDQAWADKLVFYEQWLNYVNQLREEGRQTIWAGDVNCAHNAIDLARPKDNDGVIGFHPKERAWLDKWAEDGWVDVWRTQNPNVTEVYSWWHMISRARDRNVGWRIDYFWVDKDFLSKVKTVDYLTQQLGSDHCPVVLEF